MYKVHTAKCFGQLDDPILKAYAEEVIKVMKEACPHFIMEQLIRYLHIMHRSIETLV